MSTTLFRVAVTLTGIFSNPECYFCLRPESLLHVVGGCQCYLDRFTCRHNSILNFLANTLQTIHDSALFADSYW